MDVRTRTFYRRTVISEQQLLVTAQPEFLDAAVDELKHIDKRLARVDELAPGIALCATPDSIALMRLASEQHPIFVRHLAPVQAVVPLSNMEQDIQALAIATASL